MSIRAKSTSGYLRQLSSKRSKVLEQDQDKGLSVSTASTWFEEQASSEELLWQSSLHSFTYIGSFSAAAYETKKFAYGLDD